MPSFKVIAAPHPLRDTRVAFDMESGVSIDSVLLELVHGHGAKPEELRNAAIVVNGHLIPKAEWSETYPWPGVEVIVKALPGDDFGNILLTIGSLVLAYYIPPLGPGLLGQALQIGARAGVMIASSMISQAIAPNPAATLSRGREAPPDARYSIQGVRNEMLPYGTIPAVFGWLSRYYPPLATQPYTEIAAGDDQYLRACFCVGYGPVVISNIRIGDTPIGNFRNVGIEVHEGWPTDPPLTLIPSQVREEQLSIQLTQAAGYSIRTTAVDTDEIVLDVAFPNGLYAQHSSGARGVVTVRLQVQYRPTGTSTWLAAPLVPFGVVNEGGGIFNVNAKSASAVRRSVSFTVARGQYDVQIKRVSPDDQGDHTGESQTNTVEQSYWTAIRSIKNEHPTNISGIAFIAIRAEATDQLNGVIDQLSCDVKRLVPVWDGSTWTTTHTRLPSWAFTEVLRGAANARPVADSRLDLDRMIEWAADCEALGLYFDGVFNTRSDVWSTLRQIAATGRASPQPRDGRYSVVIDKPQTQVVQHLTPRNSFGFKGTRTFQRAPHALKVRFPNRETNHQIDEQIVYADGYDVTNATEFETLDLPYTVDWPAAYRQGRRGMASAKLRPEIYTADFGIEQLVIERGDLVKVVHPLVSWGVGSARVAAVVISGTDVTAVELDAPIAVSAGVDYAVRIRTAAGESIVAQIAQDSGEITTLTFTTPIPNTDPQPDVDDLVLAGVLGQESVPLIVRSIEPRADLSATITFVDHAPEIWTVDAEPIPARNPNITLQPEILRRAPPAPQITSIASDESALIRSGDGSLTPRILIGYVVPNASGYALADRTQARWRPRYTNQDFDRASVEAGVGMISLMPVDEGDEYEIGLRTVSAAGGASEWTQTFHTVVGKSTPPPDVERIYRRGNFIEWPYPDPPIDFAGFYVRANYGTSTNVSTARALHAGIWAAPPFDVSQLGGIQTILITAVDASGNESATPANIEINFGDPLADNVIHTYAEDPTFGGTITNGTVSGGVLEADVESSPAAWGPPSSPAWGAPTDPAWPASTYAELQYAWTFTPAADELTDALAKISATVTGSYLIEYRIRTAVPYWGGPLDPAWGAPTDPAWPTSTVGSFTPFSGVLGPFDSTSDTYEFRVTVAGGTTQGAISALAVLVDVQDIVERIDSFAIGATGTRLTLAKEYRAIDNIQLAVEDDGGTAISAKIFDYQATAGANQGPLIKCYDAAGSLTTGTVSVQIQGH